MARRLRLAKIAFDQIFYLVEWRHFAQRGRHLQPHQFQHTDFQRSVFEDRYRQSLLDRPTTWRRQVVGARADHPSLLYSRLESHHQRTPVARDLWHRSRIRETTRSRKRHVRRVLAGRKITTLPY